MGKTTECFRQNQSTLHEASYDDKNDVYMTESRLPVYDFDGIKDWYWENIVQQEDKGPSNDALFYDGNQLTFIEFKNGAHISTYGKDGLVHKLQESLLILFDDSLAVSKVCPGFENSLHYTRSTMEYILVYNGEKHQEKPNPRKEIGDSLNTRARFCLGKYEGFLFHKVHTYTEKEFLKHFVEPRTISYKAPSDGGLSV